MRKIFPAAISLHLLLVSCSGGPPVISSPPLAAQGTLPTYDYALAGGDKLRVIVFGEEALGGDYTISGAGIISLPLIGEVKAQGLTATQVRDRVAGQLANGYLNEPRVAVEVLSTRPFYILGEVTRPGEYPFADGLTVEAAVARAGGYTYRAKKGQVLIKHAGAERSIRYTVTAASPVAPGDTIQIPERWF